MPRYYYSQDPAMFTPEGVAQAKAEFAKRLYGARVQKGWNQSQLARAAAKHMPGEKFGRDLVGLYERAKTLPSPQHLGALGMALRMDPNDLLRLATISRKPISATVEDAGGGKAWLRINEQVSWDTALRVMELLRGQQATE